MRILRILFLAAISSSFFSSCSPVKHLGPDAYLLNKNIIKSDKPELNEGIRSILKQKPNRKILGIFRFHLGVYTLANSGRQTSFKRWIKNTIGEEPVVLDPELTTKSHGQVLLFSQNEGYFNAEVFDSTIYKRGKKANVIYTVKTGIPYKIRTITYRIPDKTVEAIVLADTTNSLLKQGNNFRAADFQAERDRVTNHLRNMGFYEFNQIYISYDIDSSLKVYEVNIRFQIAGTNDKSLPGDSIAAGSHKMYKIKDVYVQTDFNPLAKVVKVPTDTLNYKGYYFLSSTGEQQYNPESLLMRIFIEKNDFYKIKNSDATYSGLASLSLFKFINVRYEIAQNDSAYGNWLNSFISLTPSPKQSYKIELEGTNNGGNFGVGGNFTYINKNSFKGSESIQFRFFAKIESIPDFVDSTADQTSALSLNTYELGPEITLRIPRFLWPLAKFNHTRSTNPVTLFTIAYNFQQRPEYERNLLTLSSGFEFRETRHKRHYVYPAEINYSNYKLEAAFIKKLSELDDQQLVLYYESYLIVNGRYVFVYNSQESNTFKNFLYFRFSLEIAGNSLRLIDNLAHSDYRDTSTYEILGIPYSQYVRPDFDARYYQVFSPHASLVYRVAAGIGLAYLNSDFIPYEKTFFAGGANDLRAFRPRTIGPGAYKSDNYIEQLGDIKINANLEYRVDIFKILEGAIFLDAGNVWLKDDQKNLPGSQFQFKNFISELGVGTGLGLRFDFKFFIFRIDGGIPVRNPSRDVGKRWVLNELKLNTVNYNFGIGYPF